MLIEPRIGSQFWSLVLGATLLCGSDRAAAQCATTWLPGDGMPGVNYAVTALLPWDPDGAGPLGMHVVVGGLFSSAGNIAVNRVALYDPATSTFSAMGSGFLNSVTSFAVRPNGDLIAAGEFTHTAIGVAVNHVARWNGSSWLPLGGGLTSVSQPFLMLGVTLAVLANGDLVAGGNFDTAGGTPANRIARWDGTTWHPLGTGLGGLTVSSLAVLQNGDLVAGGVFTTAGGAPASNIARWNGSTWSPMGSGTDGEVLALQVQLNGDLVAAGAFQFAGGAPASHVARWDGTAWHPLGPGIWNTVYAMTRLPNGDIVAGGASFPIARWDGTTWHVLGTMYGWAYAMCSLANGDVFAGGSVDVYIGGSPAYGNIARWNGSTWSALTRGTNGEVSALLARNEELFVGGSFNTVAGVGAARLAHWDGVAWHALGAGVDNPVLTMVLLQNGDLVVGGTFTTAGGAPANRIARWDGAAWHPLGTGMNNTVRALAVLPNGDLLAGGPFTTAGGSGANWLARWNGTTWQAFDTGLANEVTSLAVAPDGTLFAGESSPMQAVAVRRWSGTTWQSIGTFRGYSVPAALVVSLTVMDNGDLVATGDFRFVDNVTMRNVARWNGSSWQDLGGGTTSFTKASAVLPNGDLVVGGSFPGAGSVTVNNLARWNGSVWRAFGSGTNEQVNALAFQPGGLLAVGGRFTNASGTASAYFGRVATNCPATSNAIATNCVGPAGPLTLTASSLPWIGSTFHSTTTGFAPNGLGLALVGLQAMNLPLAMLHPLGLPNCDQLASANAILLVVPTNGVASYEFGIPDNPVFVGLVMLHQTLQADFDLFGAPLSLSSSNGLRLAVGSY